MNEVKDKVRNKDIKVQGSEMLTIRLANDIGILANNEIDFERVLNVTERIFKINYQMRLNEKKTKVIDKESEAPFRILQLVEKLLRE